MPSWGVTNLNGVLIIKIFNETQSAAAKREGLFEVSTAPVVHEPYQLRAVYLNMTERCNLNCVYCFAATRKEKSARLTFEDYQKLPDAVQVYNPHAEIIFTGGEPLMSPLTLLVAQYAKTLGFTRKLMTNATLINAASHDFYRGAGIFARTAKAIELLDEFSADVKLAMVITKKNVGDVAEAAERWGWAIDFPTAVFLW